MKIEICSIGECETSFINNKKDLHVHHIDGVKWNNNSNNLKVLCIDCHSKHPGHDRISRRKINKKYVSNLSFKS